MIFLKTTNLVSLTLFCAGYVGSVSGLAHPHKHLPTRTIANVTVIDTPIVRSAQEFARAHSSDFVYKHVMRSWLLGSLIIAANETLQREVDLEVHAVASLLHDLGWDQTPNSPFVSKDRRFEIDGAIAARTWIRSHKDGKHWEERRVQQVWDSIALHTEASIAHYKEAVVSVSSSGIWMDFQEPSLGVTESHFDTLLDEFPRNDLKDGTNSTVVWLCKTKPVSTYSK